MSREMKDVVVVGGGQSGLAAASVLRAAGLAPIVLEAGTEPVGSWPHYYDSLKLFSPAAYSGFPGFPFRGDPEGTQPRDEVVDYLREYAARLDADIRTGCRVTSVASTGEGGFLVTTEAGEAIHTASVVAATGSFGSPHLPALPGQDTFTGRLLHVSGYHRPDPYADQRVVVVGAGDSAVQVGYELAQVATVTLATRRPLAFLPQRIDGRDSTTGWRGPASTTSLPNGSLGSSRTPWSPTPAATEPPSIGTAGPTPDVHRVGRRARHLVRRHPRSGGHHRVRHRLPPPPRLPACPRSAHRRSSPARRGDLHHASRSGVPRHRVSTFVRVEHPPWRAPRRRVRRPRHRRARRDAGVLVRS